jgi:hypothetical protein
MIDYCLDNNMPWEDLNKLNIALLKAADKLGVHIARNR